MSPVITLVRKLAKNRPGGPSRSPKNPKKLAVFCVKSDSFFQKKNVAFFDRIEIYILWNENSYEYIPLELLNSSQKFKMSLFFHMGTCHLRFKVPAKTQNTTFFDRIKMYIFF